MVEVVSGFRDGSDVDRCAFSIRVNVWNGICGASDAVNCDSQIISRRGFTVVSAFHDVYRIFGAVRSRVEAVEQSYWRICCCMIHSTLRLDN